MCVKRVSREGRVVCLCVIFFGVAGSRGGVKCVCVLAADLAAAASTYHPVAYTLTAIGTRIACVCERRGRRGGENMCVYL